MSTEPVPAGTDAAPETPVTPVGAPGTGDAASGSDDGDKKVTISSHEYVTLKASREQAKRDAEELVELRARVQSTTNTTTDTVDDDAPIMSPAERKAYKAELRAAAKAGNRDAGAVLAGIEAAEEAKASHQMLVFQMQMEKIPEGKRDAVKKFMRDSGAPTPDIAYRLMRGGETETLEQELARTKAELAEARKAKPRVENTRIVGAPAGADDDDGVPTKTVDEYNEMMRRDPHKTIADRRAGKFRLRA